MDYVQFYTRSSPYLIGIATGYIITQIRAKNTALKLNKVKIKKVLQALQSFLKNLKFQVYVFLGWLLSTGLCLGALFGTLPFERSQLSTFENSLYLSLYRVGWGLGMAWIVFACANGYGGNYKISTQRCPTFLFIFYFPGPVNKFLSWNFFQTISKWSYSAFLLNIIIMSYRVGNSRTNSYFGTVEIVTIQYTL